MTVPTLMTSRWAALGLAAITMLPLATAAGADGRALPSRGFELFAESYAIFAVNRVSYGITSRGEFGASLLGTTNGGFWPRGTTNGYLFNSGLQFAGIIRGTKPGNPWGGDTTGAMFMDATGPRKHGTPLTPIYLGNNPGDVASWPDIARVPAGDASELLYDPLLRGRINASEGDAYFIAWDGDPALITSRSHPLGLVVEHRVLGWNYPSGNEDIIYLAATYYNVSSLNAADYAQHRPAMRAFLMARAQEFHTLNNAKFGITLPANGYTIDELHTGYSSDPDVGFAAQNFASVNLPFAIGYAYQADFRRIPNWFYDPAIFSSPFLPGTGFVGFKYLKTPLGPPAIHLYSNTCGGSGGCPSDPNNVVRLWRYLAAELDPNQGDVICGIPGNPSITHLCFVRRNSPSDVRHWQSTAGHSLGPGQSASVVVALIHAAPVAIPGFAPTTGSHVDPGQAIWIASVDSMAKYGGVNRIDSITGYLGFTDNGDGIPQADEFQVVPRSLLGKARLAQQIFDVRFLLPAAPEQPEFFLVPGDKQVTVLWKPSATETTGDPYFTIAGNTSLTSPSGTTPNALYDPNFRRFDVEGYRLYRGRTDSPGAMTLLKQWDYKGTTIKDFGGLVTVGGGQLSKLYCAPELGVTGAPDCNADFTPITPGVVSMVSVPYQLSGVLHQVNYGGRERLTNGGVVLLPGQVDTALTGQGFPQLSDNGVPFVHVDQDVRNDVRYFYAVTAFDVNSIRSGPSSLESAMATKAVTPRVSPSNVTSTGTVTIAGPFGRGATALSDVVAPTLDSVTGRFSKRPLPSNALELALASFAAQVVANGEIAVQLDSITVGNFGTDEAAPAVNWYSVVSAGVVSNISLPYTVAPMSANPVTATGSYAAVPIDPGLATQFGGGSGYSIAGTLTQTTLGGYYLAVKGRGCINAAGGFGAGRACSYNGPRWFVGDNETAQNPNSANPASFNTSATTAASYNNAGARPPGVIGLQRPNAYEYLPALYRNIEVALSPFVSESDTRIYWGDAGRIDSVIDLTHNTVVPFSTRIGATWGILNNGAAPTQTSYDQRAVLTYTDIGCVAPLSEIAAVQAQIPCTGTPAAFSRTVTPGLIAYKFTGQSFATARTAPPEANSGFLLYLRGNIYMIELSGGAIPALGAQWTVRDYVGAIRGGNGAAGPFGPYHFTPAKRPFTAVGASMKYVVTVDHSTAPITDDVLAAVHPVPDPYYVVAGTVSASTPAEISFVNVPTGARIRIYSTNARLVRVLDADAGGTNGVIPWDVKGRDGRLVASGVYFYHVEAGGRTRVGRMTVAHFGSDR